MACSDCATAFRCPIGCCVRCTKFSLQRDAVHRSTPGEFRQSQNCDREVPRPGNAAFVPPPPQDVQHCMGELEKFCTPIRRRCESGARSPSVRNDSPLLDGNGRIGRLLVTLLLRHEGVLREPLLYRASYFKQNRQRYYDELNGARESATSNAGWIFSQRRSASASEQAPQRDYGYPRSFVKIETCAGDGASGTHDFAGPRSLASQAPGKR